MHQHQNALPKHLTGSIDLLYRHPSSDLLRESHHLGSAGVDRKVGHLRMFGWCPNGDGLQARDLENEPQGASAMCGIFLRVSDKDRTGAGQVGTGRGIGTLGAAFVLWLHGAA